MKLKIGDITFEVKIANSEKSRQEGLLNVSADSIPKNAGLVLKYDTARQVPITMKGMKYPLDLVFMKEGKVQAVKQAHPEDDNIRINDVSDSVLEIKLGEGGKIKKGDLVEWVGTKDENNVIEMAPGGELIVKDTLHIVDANGKNQFNVSGNERIFSRIHTNQLYNLAKQADKYKENRHYAAVGRAMVRMINKQNTQKPQYTDD